MPGINFNRLRAETTMQQVLDAVDFIPTRRTGDQWYGACPLHEPASHREHTFSVNIATGRYYCHRCHSHGNPLELWAAFTRQRLHPASIQLCHVLGREVPWTVHF